MIVHISTSFPGLEKDLMELVRVFYPAAVLGPQDEAALFVCHRDKEEAGERMAQIRLTGIARAETSLAMSIMHDKKQDRRLHKRLVKRSLFAALRSATGFAPPWGSLTGIRPAQLIFESLKQGLDLAQAQQALVDTYEVTPQKAALLGRVVKAQIDMLQPRPDEVDLYVGLPFCPSRCRYCSFISEALNKKSPVADYARALSHEIREVAELLSAMKKRVRAVYMGGGTPTALTEQALAEVFLALRPLTAETDEFTVEAGRPDSITAEKLMIIKQAGASRLAINPQTAHDKTLSLIGRQHSWQQTVDSIKLARNLGFDNINCDLIAGLPQETLADFRMTMDAVLALNPEGITVHTLALKRSSDMMRYSDPRGDDDTVLKMLAHADEALMQTGYAPYYLYRQKNMLGHLENVGYARPGHSCLYNVDMMEDRLSVIAVGAGAISKRLSGPDPLIQRAPNVKNVGEYIARVDEMIARKKALFLEG